MGNRTTPIIERLRVKGEETADFFRGLTPDQWAAQVYEDGPQWTVREVLGHFLSAEREYIVYVQDALDGGDGAPPDFDIDGFNAEAVAALGALAPAELIAQFEQARAATIATVEGMADSDLDREGRHPFFGWDRMEKFLKLVYRHNMIHERDVRRALGM